jgi:hypothetical protein
MKALASLVACAVVSLLVNAPIFAQGKSQSGNGKSGGNAPPANGSGNPGKSSNAGGNGGGGGGASSSSSVSPPSQVALAAPASVTTSTSASTPFAWMDNANLIAPGAVWIGISTVRWQNAGASQISFPVVDAAIGMTPRFQIGASVPRIVGSDALSQPGGLGTTFFNAKVGVLNDSQRSFKVAVAPTLEVLSEAAMQFAPIEQSRVQWGLPVSAEFDRGKARVYGSTGYFSPGVWYTGAGAGTQISSRIGVAVSFSRSWSRSALDDPAVAAPTRHDLSTGISLELTPRVGVFGSVGRTFNTAAEYGAGTTVSVGVSLTASRIAFTQ